MQVRKIMCNRAAAIYFDYKNAKPSHFDVVLEKEILDSNSKENHFVVSKIQNFLIIVLVTQKLNFDFVLFHLNAVMLNQRRFNT